jgi:hypothetical protein
MTGRERVRRTRLTLGASAIVASLLWGGAASAGILAALGLADWVVGVPRAVRELALVVAALAALAAVAVTLWRARRVRSLERVALWIEEREPRLRYALVTLVGGAVAEAAPLEQAVSRTSWAAALARASLRALVPPLAILAVAVVALLALPHGVVARVTAPRAGDALDRLTSAPGTPRELLRPLVVRVTPPVYAGLRGETLEDPTRIAALVGSAITVEGPAGGDVGARVGEREVAVDARNERWHAAFAMPDRAVALRLRSPARERVLVLEPRADSAPSVTLAQPARDTVLRRPSGRVALDAEARDDLGLVSGWFEVIVSSGEGESFTFRSATLGRRTLGRARQAALAAVLPIDSLALTPGDVVHVRAVARDANDVTGPGQGASETRTIRIARTGEYDSVAVEGAPPPDADKSALSQRMLIMMTETLVRRQPRLTRDTVMVESRRIASDQARLRRRVSEIIFSRLEDDGTGGEHSHEGEEGAPGAERGDLSPDALLQAAEEATAHAIGEGALDFEGGESPVVAINKPLLEAYNAMWDAGRELEIGEPARALPHMRVALEAIQRARAAERIYLRGRPPVAVVDLQKVRLAGDRSEAAPRPLPAPPPSSDPLVVLGARLDRAIVTLAHDPSAAVDSLLLVRLDALEPAPALAAAVADAVDAIRRGSDATDALVRARRATLGAVASSGGVSAWGSAW